MSNEDATSETVYRLRRDELDWVTVDDEVVVLDSKDDLYLGANPSGALLWGALHEGATRSELTGLLCDSYTIELSTAELDVDRFLQSLLERRLLDES